MRSETRAISGRRPLTASHYRSLGCFALLFGAVSGLQFGVGPRPGFEDAVGQACLTSRSNGLIALDGPLAASGPGYPGRLRRRLPWRGSGGRAKVSTSLMSESIWRLRRALLLRLPMRPLCCC